MAVQCGVVLVDRSQVRTPPGPQPQRGPPHATGRGSGPPAIRGERSDATGDTQLIQVHWNPEAFIRRKRTSEILKRTLHPCVHHPRIRRQCYPVRFCIQGYETYRQDRENRLKGRSCYPGDQQHPTHRSTEIRSRRHRIPWNGTDPPRQAPPGLQHLLPSSQPIALHSIHPSIENWIIMGSFNSQLPSWGYTELDNKGDEVESWAINQQLILVTSQTTHPATTQESGGKQVIHTSLLQPTISTRHAPEKYVPNLEEATTSLSDC